jgi:hypothetical protein
VPQQFRERAIERCDEYWCGGWKQGEAYPDRKSDRPCRIEPLEVGKDRTLIIKVVFEN